MFNRRRRRRRSSFAATPFQGRETILLALGGAALLAGLVYFYFQADRLAPAPAPLTIELPEAFS